MSDTPTPVLDPVVMERLVLQVLAALDARYLLGKVSYACEPLTPEERTALVAELTTMLAAGHPGSRVPSHKEPQCLIPPTS